jgi:hypothetical protein
MSSSIATPAVTAPVTKAGTPLVKIALSRAKRAGGIFSRIKSGERLATGLRANDCHTGSWRWHYRSRSGWRHEITLDPNAHASVSKGLEPDTAEGWLAYFGRILRHEVHHALHTDRNNFAVQRSLAAIGVPFVAMNIVEDMRIDTLARATDGDYRWTDYFQPASKSDAVLSEPLAWLLWHKLCEGQWKRLRHRVSLDPAKIPANVERVRRGVKEAARPAWDVLETFAAEFMTAASTLALVPLLEDLFQTFPSAERDATKIGGLPGGAMGHGYSYNGGGMAGKDTAEPTPLTGEEYDKADPHTVPPHIVEQLKYFAGIDGLNMAESQFDDTWGRRAHRDIAEQARRTAARMAGLLGTVGGPAARVSIDGSRVHMAGVMVGDARSFRTATRRGERPKVVAIFDQSGSMNHHWTSHGAAFMGALLLLHQQGRINATCILTGDHRHAIVPPEFPVAKVSRFLCLGGCESVDKTLDANKAWVQDADIVLIYTDGALTDGNVDAARWRSHGVDLIGTCVTAPIGNGTDAENKRNAMTKHFHRAILADDGDKLATKIVQYIATR